MPEEFDDFKISMVTNQVESKNKYISISKCQRIHKTRQNKKRSHKKRTTDLWNTRREIQTQTELDQPS